ncbi:MAG: M20/M25/M40 family metallo-hydrolase [Acidobacteria bacterium]|nr:M20/M25/M40 family metallo-hydrolase [Acidobacteriota bacterium]
MVKLLVYGLAATALAAETTGERWWAHVQFLADDRLEGRNAGSAGHEEAARYVADQFRLLGLSPGAGGQWLQQVPFVTRQVDETASSLELVIQGKARPLTLGKEAYFAMRANYQPATRASLVFAGQGLVVPEMNHDDLKGLDLKGKVAVILTGAPSHWPGALAAHVQNNEVRWAAFRKAGAIGLISIPKVQTTPWVRSSAARLQAQMSAVIPGSGAESGPQLSVTFNPDHAALLFEGTGHTFQEVLGLSNENRPLPRFELKKEIAAKVAVKRGELTSPNVVAILPGTGKESVVVSAHLDHIGKTVSFAGDGIFNGAIDNASGVAAMIEVARLLKKKPRRRSIVFVALTGEEKGLQGSRYFAATSARNVVAACNMDMFMPLHELKALTFLGGEESTLGDWAAETAGEFGLQVIPDPAPEQRRFTRSDQYSFVRQGIPALNFKFGYTKGSKEEAVQAEWLKTRYHAVGDDLAQPVNIEGAGRFTEFLAALVDKTSTRKARPVWKRDSFFRRFKK